MNSKLERRIGIWLAAVLFATGLKSAMAAESRPQDAPRARICLNGMWEVAPAMEEVVMPKEGWTGARIPAVPIVDKNVKGRWCRLSIDVPREWGRPGRRFILEFEKVGHYAAVFCNGKKVGEHYGQYAPFEFEVTEALRIGERNEISVYVHNAMGKFARAGANITDEMVGNAYRAATNAPEQRNWIGIVGDVTLSWRPATGIDGAFVETSIREKKVSVEVETGKLASGARIKAAVLDGTKELVNVGEAEAGD